VSNPAAEYEAVFRVIEEAHKESLRAFAAWFVKEWTMTREQWLNEFADPPPEGDYFDGYNAGVESILSALDSFLDEHHP